MHTRQVFEIINICRSSMSQPISEILFHMVKQRDTYRYYIKHYETIIRYTNNVKEVTLCSKQKHWPTSLNLFICYLKLAIAGVTYQFQQNKGTATTVRTP